MSADAGKNEATVSWLAPEDPSGISAITYTVTSNTGGLTCTTQRRSCTVKGLTADVEYTFTVVATTVIGGSVASVPSASLCLNSAFDARVLTVKEAGLGDGATHSDHLSF